MKVDDESRCTILKGIWQIYRVKKNSTEEVGWRQKKVDKWRQKRDREKAKQGRRKGENRAWKMRPRNERREKDQTI